jgi:transcriptional regulator with XRE-family HTH domain
MTKTGFGLLLQNLREGRKLSLRELAQLSEVDHAYIYRLENGEKVSPSEDVILKLIRALKAGKREADMIRYLAKHTDTDNTLIDLILKDQTISYEIFTSAAGAAFRGSGRPDYPKLIERVRKILKEEKKND